MSRLSIEIEPEQHRQIKTLATYAGMSIKDFILSMTLNKTEPGADATDQLLSSKSNAKRLREAINVAPSEHRIFESVEDLKHALGI